MFENTLIWIHEQYVGLTYEVLQGILFIVLTTIIFTWSRDQKQVRLTLAGGFSRPLKTSAYCSQYYWNHNWMAFH